MPLRIISTHPTPTQIHPKTANIHGAQCLCRVSNTNQHLIHIVSVQLSRKTRSLFCVIFMNVCVWVCHEDVRSGHVAECADIHVIVWMSVENRVTLWVGINYDNNIFLERLPLFALSVCLVVRCASRCITVPRFLFFFCFASATIDLPWWLGLCHHHRWRSAGGNGDAGAGKQLQIGEQRRFGHLEEDLVRVLVAHGFDRFARLLAQIRVEQHNGAGNVGQIVACEWGGGKRVELWDECTLAVQLQLRYRCSSAACRPRCRRDSCATRWTAPQRPASIRCASPLRSPSARTRECSGPTSGWSSALWSTANEQIVGAERSDIREFIALISLQTKRKYSRLLNTGSGFM